MKSVVVGGTAGLGRDLATLLAERGHSLLITGKDKRDVDTCVSDLYIRYGVSVYGLSIDASDQENFERSLKIAAASFGTINYLFLPIGASNNRDNGNIVCEELNEIITSNFTSVVTSVQVFRSQLTSTENAAIVGFSSVAAIRGRAENVIYAAAKRALESYFESLNIMLIDSNVNVKYYKLGYLDTYQSFGKQLPLPKKNPKKAARNVITHLNRVRLVSYYPKYWRVIAILIQIVPSRIFSRITP
jgi:decaprenylphospho-beta-D-erythro-pentofuranosid-2-ulose 2-reductase